MKHSYAAVRQILQQCGPLTMHEVAAHFPDVPYQDVGSILHKMHKGLAKQQVYIVRWTYYGIGRRYPRAVYALGCEPDAAKPVLESNAERLMRQREKKKYIKRIANSVWTWRPGA